MWSVGEKVVFQGHPMRDGRYMSRGQPLRIGETVTVIKHKGVHDHARGPCVFHPNIPYRVIVTRSRWAYCPHCFKKPLNFEEWLKTAAKDAERELVD